MKTVTLLSSLAFGLLLVGCQPASVESGNSSSAPIERFSTSDPAPTGGAEPTAADPQLSSGMEKPSGTKPKAGEEVAVIETKFGKIVFKFRKDKAPKTAASFIKLAKSKFYDGLTFHRVIPGFMIQGGCPNTKKGSTGIPGTGDAGFKLKNEFNNLHHGPGVVSMARSNDPDSAGSQFFICVDDADSLDRQYTAFGEVVSGQSVADKIVNVPRNRDDRPDERVEMKVSIKTWPVK